MTKLATYQNDNGTSDFGLAVRAWKENLNKTDAPSFYIVTKNAKQKTYYLGHKMIDVYLYSSMPKITQCRCAFSIKSIQQITI